MLFFIAYFFILLYGYGVPKNIEDGFLHKKLLLFIGAKSNKERDIIAKGNELLMDANEWIKYYQSDESFREFTIKHHEYWTKREAHNEGLEEGKNERNIEIAKNMLKKYVY